LLYLGTSGWQYRHWRNTFYPQGGAQSRWLEFYAERFQIVELNNSFYRLPPYETFVKWRERTPDDFIFAAKMSRFLTHIKKLKDPTEPVERFFRHAAGLGPKLGPVLIQLPPTLRADLGALEETLSLIPDGKRVAVEFRHDSWFTEGCRAVLEKYGAANCMADRLARPWTPTWRTADWTFLRFHEGTGRPHPCYKRKTMEPWVEMLAERWGIESDAYVFFNNDPRACALRDVTWFGELAENAGFQVTRVPKRSEIRVGDDETAAWATS
jgi:uncharacterized protein YecE (DUF72 family)